MTLRGNSNKSDASGSAAGSNSVSSKTDGERHGSSDTVRGPFGSLRGTPKINTNKKLQYVHSILLIVKQCPAGRIWDQMKTLYMGKDADLNACFGSSERFS